MVQRKTSMLFSIKLISATWIVLGLYYFLYCVPYPNYPQTSTTKLIDYPQGQKGVVQQIGFLLIDSMAYSYNQQMPILTRNIKQQKGHLLNMISVIPTWTSIAVRSLFTGSNLFELVNLQRITKIEQNKMDNLYKQIIASNKTIMAMGDSVWIEIFNFDQSKQYFDFNSFDHRQEKYSYKWVLKQFDEQLHVNKNGTSINKFVLGHYQQLDSNAHHHKDTRKVATLIKQIDKWIDNQLNLLNNNTFFLVIGDHGSTFKGQHAGNSKEQMQTFLYTYFKTDQNYKSNTEIKNKVRIIDIASTLSILYDVPLPSNSVGYPIIQILPQTYHKYFGQIELKVLRHYKKLIDFYQFQDSLQCSRIHYWLQDSEKAAKSPSDGSLYIERKHKIVQELYQNCLAKLLTTKPYSFANVIPFGLIFVLYFAFKKIYPKIILNQTTIKEFICLFGTRTLVPLSLFIKYNLLTYYEILFIFLLLTAKNIQKGVKMVGILIILALPIFQEIGFHYQYSHSITYNADISQSLLKSVFWREILGFIFFIGFLGYVFWLGLPLWKSIIKIQWKMKQKKMVLLGLTIAIELIMELLMVFFSLLAYMNFQMIYGDVIFIEKRRIVLIIFTLVYILRTIIYLLRRINKHNNREQALIRTILTFSFKNSHCLLILLIPVLRMLQPFVAFLIFLLIKLINKKQVNTFMTFILCDIFWKCLGNSDEYSSFDSVKQNGYFQKWGFKTHSVLIYYASSIYFIGLCVINEELKNQNKINGQTINVGLCQQDKQLQIIQNSSTITQVESNSAIQSSNIANGQIKSDKFEIEFVKFIFPVYAGIFTALISILPREGTQQSFPYLIIFNYSAFHSISIAFVGLYYVIKIGLKMISKTFRIQ